MTADSINRRTKTRLDVNGHENARASAGDIFSVSLLILASGSPAVNFLGTDVVQPVLFGVSCILWGLKARHLGRANTLLFCAFVLLICFQIAIFGLIVAPASLGLLIRLLTAAILIRCVGRFNSIFIDVMVALGVVSIVFWVPTAAGLDVRDAVATLRLPLGVDEFHIFLHNFREEADAGYRNMGIFWEPGAFAGYLLLGLLFVLNERGIKGVLTGRGLILIVTLLSTQSTTGYLGLGFLLMCYSLDPRQVRNRYLRVLIVPLVILLAYGLYSGVSTVGFLGDKIDAQFDSAVVDADGSRINRFGNLYYDLEWIAERPILGWGATPATRFGGDAELSELLKGQGNGLTGFVVKFGVFGALLFFWGAWRAMIVRGGEVRDAVAMVVLLAMILNGEQFLNYPLLFCVMFAYEQARQPSCGVKRVGFGRGHGASG